MIRYFFLLSFAYTTTTAISQQLSYTDPAAAYNRLLLDKNNSNTNEQIRVYKVIGSACLLGSKLKGNIYIDEGKAENILVSYNTYYQRLELYQDSKQEGAILKQVNEIDSFKLFTSAIRDFNLDLSFVRSRLIQPAAKKYFLQKVFIGDRFSLGKAYKSDLGIVSTNYIQADLRQFDLQFDYYFYIDSTIKEIKKFKVSSKNIKNEFKLIKDVSSIADGDAFYLNPDMSLKQIFTLLNSK